MAGVNMLAALVLVTLAGAQAANTPVGTSTGSCYDSTTHVVACFQDQTECEAESTNYFYAAGYTSGQTGCCHCLTDCTDDAGMADSCSWYDTYNDYVSVSDVSQHARMTLDVGSFETFINDADYTSAKGIYTDGENSVKGSGMRTLQGMAQKDLTGEPFFDESVEHFGGSLTFLDDFMTAVLDGTGMFEGASDAVRDQAADKTAQCILTMYASHELFSAISKANEGKTEDTGAPHAWDEGYVFYYGTHNGEGGDSNWEVQGKRDSDFGTTNQAAADAAFWAGLAGVRAGGKIADSEAEYEKILDTLGITYAQAGLKYAYKVSSADPVPTELNDELMEGYAYWRCGAGWIYSKDKDMADAVTKAYEDAIEDPAGKNADLFCTVHNALSGMADIEWTAGTLGTYDSDFKAIDCGESSPASVTGLAAAGVLAAAGAALVA
jgi:hypothetical protein